MCIRNSIHTISRTSNTNSISNINGVIQRVARAGLVVVPRLVFATPNLLTTIIHPY